MHTGPNVRDEFLGREIFYSLKQVQFHSLHEVWSRPERRDKYFGTLLNAWIATVPGAHTSILRCGCSGEETE